ncbi:hypothetical protein NE237_025092 [Protea cynaroides]|uniref:Uncharacterized protein n=1 Tax=Protea cynaroides TaxID=273540 RepID=A0A9Q0H176_9MAGN|nr:hypothetical protein NE237_025092 [Protea cynaroides]
MTSFNSNNAIAIWIILDELLATVYPAPIQLNPTHDGSQRLPALTSSCSLSTISGPHCSSENGSKTSSGSGEGSSGSGASSSGSSKGGAGGGSISSWQFWKYIFGGVSGGEGGAGCSKNGGRSSGASGNSSEGRTSECIETNKRLGSVSLQVQDHTSLLSPASRIGAITV